MQSMLLQRNRHRQWFVIVFLCFLLILNFSPGIAAQSHQTTPEKIVYYGRIYAEDDSSKSHNSSKLSQVTQFVTNTVVFHEQLMNASHIPIEPQRTPPEYGNGLRKPDNFLIHLPFAPGTTSDLRYYTYGVDTHSGLNYYAVDFNLGGANVHSIASGIVVWQGERPPTPQNPRNYGKIVFVEHRPQFPGYVSLYAHLDSIHVQTGQNVDVLTSLGIEGATGGNYTRHLHFAIWYCPGIEVGEYPVSSGKCTHSVVPEPILGREVYEGLGWWSQLSPSTRLIAERRPLHDNSSPTGAWGMSATSDGELITPNNPIRFGINYADNDQIGEVRLTAYYLDWASDNTLRNFNTSQVWRIIARCNPRDATPISGCTPSGWQYIWDPYTDNGNNGRPDTTFTGWLDVPWLPKANVAGDKISSRDACISFDIFDRAGNPLYSPGGMRCNFSMNSSEDAVTVSLNDNQARYVQIMPFSSVLPNADQATFIRDVTLPDNTVVPPGANLIKTWRVRNSGTSTWNGYRLIFRSGNQMGAPASVNIPYTPPGHEVDISVPIVAPQASARGDWHIVNTSGTLVRNGGMWVILTVQGTEPVVTSDIDLECVNNTCYATVTPGQTFRPTIRATVNTGQLLQSRGDMLRHKAGDLFGAWPHVAVQGTVNTGQSYDFTFYADNPIQAPTQEGTYQNTWQVWRNGNWAGEEFTLRFTVSQSGSNNRAPNRPTLTGPSDWAVYQGNTGITLSAQHNGDPDGDAVTHYYFDIFESAQLANSGWIASNSWSPQGLGYYGYQWRVKVRDSHGAESSWSDVRHFTVYNPQITITQLDFVPLGNGEQVRIMACASGTANTLKVQVNTANDGSDNGEWRTLKELGVPCFNEIDAPVWTILNYASGPHRVRVLARGDGGWENAAVLEKTYTVAANLRPNSPSGILPSDRSYLNSRMVNFQWTETFRTTGYQLQASESATFDTLLLDQTFPADMTQHTQIFSADYATVYWRITAVGPYGTHESNRRFHIDLDAPTSSMTALPPVTTDTKFNVNWTSTDARSGVRWYHVQMRDVSRPDSAWEDWLVNTTKQAELFQGQPGHTYAFRVRAMDNIGNWEAWPDADYGQTHTLIDPASAPPTAWWDTNYAHKRNLVILNNDSNTMPADFPIHIRFDATTTPSAAEIYNASLAATKGNDVRVVYDNQTELHRFVQRFTPDQIDLWFPLQAALGGGQTNSGDYQLYYGHAGGSSPPSVINTVFLPKTDGNTMGLWHFQDGSGSTVVDTSGRNHNGSFTNGSWADGFTGWAGAFNGSTTSVSISHSNDFNSNQLTLEAWVYVNGFDGRGHPVIIKRVPYTPGGFEFRFTHDREVMLLADLTTGVWDVRSSALEAERWYHIAGVFNGSDEICIYINGTRSRCREVTSGQLRFNTGPVTIGFSHVGTGIQYFPGLIQHVRISNVARTSFPYARITTPPSVEAGLPIAPSAPGAPDLAVLNLTTYPNPDGGLLIVTQVENQGDADTQSNFYTDLYVNHLPTGAGDYTGSLQFWVNMPIEVGAQITLTTIITDLAGMGGYMMHALSAPGAEVTATLYAQVDSVGVISETDTTNNISPGVEICLASPDAYEGDDDISGAAWLNLGEVQQRNFNRPTDRDWVKFTAHGDVTYTLRTFDLGNAADTYLYLYDTDGATLLAANDDYDGSLASRIDWMAPVTGTYYALVQHWNPNVGGCGTGYKLSLTEQLTIHTLYLPLIVRN